MLVSYDKQFLFIHVPKTAGTSIRASLGNYACRPEKLWENRLLSSVGVNVNVIGPWRRKRFRPHCSAQDVQRQLPAQVFEKLFKFAFVRNPWDLLVSLYNFIPTRPNHRHQKRVAAMSFAEFVDEWTQHPEIFQARRIRDSSGTQLVNFVGFFEDVARDFEVVCNRIGVSRPPLPRNNRSVHADYRDVYTDHLKNMVATRLAEDIEFLGYDFDGPAALRQQELQSQENCAA
ncbi:MAG: sulfotransferase family protein [Fuerstiella sp.]|nr:sulfotransferase family protein [Fuerstiella sp.]